MEEKKSSGMFAVFAALGANVLVAISKFIVFGLSGSAAMLNESIHSVVDCGNQILLLFGDRRSRQASTNLHQFGEARAKYFFSMIVATFLFFGGGVIGVMEAYDKLVHPAHSVENAGIVIGILLIGMAIEGSSLRVAFKEISELNTEKLPIFKFLHESRHSEILVIFAEDLCAIIGPIFDAISGLLIGFLLMAAAIFLTREFYSLIVGERVTDSDLEKILTAFDRPEVERVINVKTVHLGPTEILIAAKIDLVSKLVLEDYEIINQIEAEIRKKISDKKCYIYIEIDEFVQGYVQSSDL